MILQCGECGARYIVPDTSIGPEGRTVRCARCKHSWFATLPAPAAGEKPPPAIPDFDAILAGQSPAPAQTTASSAKVPALRAPKPAPLWFTLTTLATAAACIVLMLLAFKPAWIGFRDTSGIHLKDITFKKTTFSKRDRYTVRGMIVNNTGRRITAPIIRISLTDDHGNKLQYWEFRDETVNVEPGQAIPFNAEKLDSKFTRGTRLVVDLGNSLELALRTLE